MWISMNISSKNNKNDVICKQKKVLKGKSQGSNIEEHAACIGSGRPSSFNGKVQMKFLLIFRPLLVCMIGFVEGEESK